VGDAHIFPLKGKQGVAFAARGARVGRLVEEQENKKRNENQSHENCEHNDVHERILRRMASGTMADKAKHGVFPGFIFVTGKSDIGPMARLSVFCHSISNYCDKIINTNEGGETGNLKPEWIWGIARL
jgi:hypothetical protein